MPVDTDGDSVALRSTVRDLVALSAMPAAWAGREPATVASGLADTLIGLLRLDFAFVRLCVPGFAGAVDARRGQAWPAFSEWLESHLAGGGRLSGKEIVSCADDAPGQYRAVVIPVGVNAEGGVVAAVSDRADFPTETDEVLLGLAANHAATVFQSGRLSEQQAQMRFLESMDRVDRAIQRTSDLEQMLGDVLDVVLATFGCDRAWLVYPCDPDVFRPGDPDVAHRVRVERTRPGFTGVSGAGADIPNDPQVAGVSAIALAAGGPVRFDPGSGRAVPARLTERFGVRSMLAMAVYPRKDKPSLFGLHQCSHPRVWTPQEEQLFHEIGRRLCDALDTQLMLRDLRESERKLERSRAELTASRARIVTAADETRRRIERDLHDGVQQRLVWLALAQRMAEALVPSGLPELSEQLSQVTVGLTGALEELQEISRGIHPAILARGGLGPALREIARRSPVPVDLEVRAATRLPEPVEVAAYYAVSEALTNTAKHAGASAVDVAVEQRAGALELSVCDDGCGGADQARGSGLIGLTDRVDALGGTIDVSSPVGQGTTVRITLPLNEHYR